MIMETETYTLNLNKKQFELLDMILFEEWRDYVDCLDDEVNDKQKYVSEDDHPYMYSVKDFNSLSEVLKIEKLRKGLNHQWGN